MDWFLWLSKTNLEPQYIHEYTQSFTQNLLEEDDISYFNHEFLQSMGISIAKHRLEILKLAKISTRSHPIAKLINAMKKTKTKVVKCVQTWVHRNDSAIIMVKRRSYSSRWKGAMVKRSNRLVMNKQGGSGSGMLLITNGYRPVVRPNGARVTSFSSPLVYDIKTKEDSNEYRDNLYSDDDEGSNDGEDRSRGASGDGGYWPNDGGVEEIKWDAMFQNLKPT
ncbi:sterile alpha motif/pointed domain-containing protein [Tanacetum coccineum]